MPLLQQIKRAHTRDRELLLIMYYYAQTLTSKKRGVKPGSSKALIALVPRTKKLPRQLPILTYPPP